MLWPRHKWTATALRTVSVAASILVFVLSLWMLWCFDSSSPDLQMVQRAMWLPSMGVSYFVGVDGVSVLLVVLTTFLTPLALLAANIKKQAPVFMALVLFLESTMLGTFLAWDAILFYIFFETSLVPMYFLIGVWGGQRRIYATVKFFIYTMVGSLFMLLGIIALMFMAGAQAGQLTASLIDFYNTDIPFVRGVFFSSQTLLFFVFALAFAIKVPLFPLHTWLPDAHVEAPTTGSVILAGVLLKMGTYGLLRVMPLFSQATQHWGWLFVLLAVFGIVYGALVAMVQTDVKKLVAYSSVSHMGYVVLGLFCFNVYGWQGGLYQMLNHGISTGALFLLVGMVYERTHTRLMADYGGLASVMPHYTILFLIVSFSSIAVPMTNGFVGEFLILLGAFQAQPWAAAVAVTGVVLGAAYMLWMIKRVFFGPVAGVVKTKKLHDLTRREWAVLLPLVLLIFWMGLKPGVFLNFSRASSEHWLNNFNAYTIQVHNKDH